MVPSQDWKALTRIVFGLALATVFLLPRAQAQELSSALIPKFVEPLIRVCGLYATPNCKFMPLSSVTGTSDFYDVAVRQFTQQILPPNDINGHPFKKSTVWGFGNPAVPSSFSYPAFTIQALTNRTVRVKWINDLKYKGGPKDGQFITYPVTVPVSTDNHWANPPQSCVHGKGTDCQGDGGNYFGPVPTIVHLHGAKTESESDGIPEAWNLPAANNIPAGYATHGSDYCQTNSSGMRACTYNGDGAALFSYENHMDPATLFFHDHTLGVTIQNVYMGMVGFYLIGGGPKDVLPNCASTSLIPNNQCNPTGGLPAGDYEIPLALQDKSFNTSDDALLFREEGNTIVVNGKTWPYLEVEPRKYRFRLVDGAAERFFSLSFPEDTRLKFTQIGADGGFLPHPVQLSSINLTPGERADVVVDFKGLNGQHIILLNDESGDTGQVIEIRVSNNNVTDSSAIPTTLPTQPAYGGVTAPTRRVALFDHMLGPIDQAGNATPMDWDAPVTETPTCGAGGCAASPAIEEWDIYGLQDDHPIHIHEAQFEVIGRTDLNGNHFKPPSPGETGFKDTALAHGGQILKIKVKFDRGGLFAWHCHLITHEDEGMMRPLCIIDPTSTIPCTNVK